MGRGQEPVDQPSRKHRGRGRQPRRPRTSSGGRRQADQVEAQPADQGPAVGLGRGARGPFASRPARTKASIGSLDPSAVLHRRRRPAGGSARRPSGPDSSPLGDPSLEQILLRGRKDLGRIGGRHDLFGVVAEDAATTPLASARPGTMASFAIADSRTSSRRPALRWPLSGPWQRKQFSERIGRMSRLNSTGSAARLAEGAKARSKQTRRGRVIGVNPRGYAGGEIGQVGSDVAEGDGLPEADQGSRVGMNSCPTYPVYPISTRASIIGR